MGAHACAANASNAAVGVWPVLSRLAGVVTATALAICLTQPAFAQQRSAIFAVPYSGTLKRIHDSGIIRIGHRQNSRPFAFLDRNGKPIGYSLDLCEIVVEEHMAGKAA